MTYTIQPGVVLAQICDDYLLVASGDARGKVPYVRKVNQTGAYFWQLLTQGLEDSEIVSRAVQDYGIPDALAWKALSAFVTSLQSANYLLSPASSGANDRKAIDASPLSGEKIGESET